MVSTKVRVAHRLGFGSIQSTKFRGAARAIGCDEDEAAFEKRLREIAKVSSPPKPQKATKKASK